MLRGEVLSRARVDNLAPLPDGSALFNAPIDSYTLANASARFSWKTGTGLWGVTLFARNLFNEKYLVDRARTNETVGPPRFVGVKFDVAY